MTKGWGKGFARLRKSGVNFFHQIHTLNMEVQNWYKAVQFLKAKFAEMKLEVKAMLKELKLLLINF